MRVVGSCILLLLLSRVTTVELVWPGKEGRPCVNGLYCAAGQKCDNDTCIPCEQGFFQANRSHQLTFCIKWQRKPPGPYWEIIVNGTAERDRVWDCEEGSERRWTAPWESFCVSKTEGRQNLSSVSDPPKPTRDQIPLKAAVEDGISESRNPTRSTSNLDVWWKVLLISVSVAVVIVVLLMIAFLLRKKIKSCHRCDSSNVEKGDQHSQRAEMEPLNQHANNGDARE